MNQRKSSRGFLLVAALLHIVGNSSTASAQLADSVRLGASPISRMQASRGLPATRVDTASITIVRPSRVGKYITIGAATGLLAGIAAVAYEANSCNGHSTNGIPACLGIDAVAFVTLAAGILAGSGVGWISGAVADGRHW